jgi:hypothetical protein
MREHDIVVRIMRHCRTESLHSDFEYAFRNRFGAVLSRAEIQEILEETFGNFPRGSVIPTDHAEFGPPHVNQCRICINPAYQIFETVVDGQGEPGVARYRVRQYNSTARASSQGWA